MREFTRRQLLRSAIGAAVGKTKAGKGLCESRTASPVIVSAFAKSDWRPDGNLEKLVWSRAAPVHFDQDAFSEGRYPEFRTTVASSWTAKFLYLAFWCPYRELSFYQGEDTAVERWRLWERDVVEAFINPALHLPSHYYEFEVAPNNQWLDLEIDLARGPLHNPKWNSGFEHATRIDPKAHIWTAEMRIPAVSMKAGEIGPDLDWRANFYRCDGPGDDRGRRMMSWGQLPKRFSGASFHQPDSFGILRFSGP